MGAADARGEISRIDVPSKFLCVAPQIRSRRETTAPTSIPSLRKSLQQNTRNKNRPQRKKAIDEEVKSIDDRTKLEDCSRVFHESG